MYDHGKIAKTYIVSEISENYDISSYPTLKKCLFGVITTTKKADFDKYKNSGFGIDMIEKDFLIS